jgi:hypothetical protein
MAGTYDEPNDDEEAKHPPDQRKAKVDEIEHAAPEGEPDEGNPGVSTGVRDHTKGREGNKNAQYAWQKEQGDADPDM